MWHRVAPGAGRGLHRRADRPARLRRELEAATARPTTAVLEAGDGARPGRGDARARLRPVRRRRATTAAGGSPTGWRSTTPSASTRARGARHRPDRRGLARAPTARSASATGTGSSSPSPRRLPERLIGADPDAYFLATSTRTSSTPRPSPTTAALPTTPRRSTPCARTTAPAPAYDVEHDLADRNHRRRIACPLLALWGGRGSLEDWYDVLGDLARVGRRRQRPRDRRRALPRRGAPGRRPRSAARLLRYDPLLSGAPLSVAFEMTTGTIGCSLPFAGTFAMRSTVAWPSVTLPTSA